MWVFPPVKRVGSFPTRDEWEGLGRAAVSFSFTHPGRALHPNNREMVGTKPRSVLVQEISC